MADVIALAWQEDLGAEEGGFREKEAFGEGIPGTSGETSTAPVVHGVGPSFGRHDFGGIEKKRGWESDHPSPRLFEQNADVDLGYPSEEFRSWKGKAQRPTTPGGVSITTAPGWLDSSRAITTACKRTGKIPVASLCASEAGAGR
ncbi:MAG: hypothetical protein AB1898_32425 [Acidobacteriota bacterium]